MVICPHIIVKVQPENKRSPGKPFRKSETAILAEMPEIFRLAS